MTVENISRSISTKECCRPRWGLNPDLLVSSQTVHPTEPPKPAIFFFFFFLKLASLAIQNVLSEDSHLTAWMLRLISSFAECTCPKECFLTFCITKTYLYNFDPLKPHFYIVKLGFTGVHIIFLISAQNIDCGYSLESSHRGSSNKYPESMF